MDSELDLLGNREFLEMLRNMVKRRLRIFGKCLLIINIMFIKKINIKI